jgi:phosphate transport system substrate-binding protein
MKSKRNQGESLRRKNMKKFFNMKKIVSFMLVFTMMFVLSACGKKEKPDENKTDIEEQTPEATETPTATETPDETETAALAGTVSITGSTSVEKILMDMINDFTAFNPDVKINYTGTGSSAGITDAMNGANDIGASSRNLKDEEKGLEQVVFAYDGIAVVLHPSNKIADLSIDQILKIYSGEITNWSELGGNDADIIVVSREGASGTKGAFEELIKLEDAGGLVESTTVVEGNGNVQATVAGNENAIGYVSFSFINETVKAVTVDGVAATPENAKSGTYVLSRPFILVYNKDTVSPEAAAFLEYVVGADAQEFVEDHGGIRID